MCSEQTILYTEGFKSNVMKFTKQHDNTEAERHSGPLSPEKMSEEESRGRIPGREEQTVLHIHIANWPYVEADVKNQITGHKNNGMLLVGQLLGVTYF